MMSEIRDYWRRNGSGMHDSMSTVQCSLFFNLLSCSRSISKVPAGCCRYRSFSSPNTCIRFGPAVFTERMRQYSFSFHLVFRYTSSLYAYTCSCSFSQSSRGVSLRWETKWEKHMNNGAPTVAGGRAVRKSRSSDRQLSDVLSFSFVVEGSEEKPAGSSFVLLLNNRAPALLYY